LSAGHPAAGCSALLVYPLRCARRARDGLLLDLDADGPDKAGQLARHRRHYLLLDLAARHEPDVAVVQPVLRFPGDLLHLLARVRLAPPQLAAHVGPMAIRPGRLDEDATQVRIAGLGDRAAPHPLAA